MNPFVRVVANRQRDPARGWFDVLTDAMGVEGPVVTGAHSRWIGPRNWQKVNSVGDAVFDELTRGTCDQVSNGSRGA